MPKDLTSFDPPKAARPARNRRRSRPPIGGCRSQFAIIVGLIQDRIRKSRNELYKIGLAVGAGLLEKAAEVRLNRRLRDSEGLRDLGNAPDLDDGQQHPQLG